MPAVFARGNAQAKTTRNNSARIGLLTINAFLLRGKHASFTTVAPTGPVVSSTLFKDYPEFFRSTRFADYTVQVCHKTP